MCVFDTVLQRVSVFRSKGPFTGSQVALSEDAHFFGEERAGHAVQDTLGEERIHQHKNSPEDKGNVVQKGQTYMVVENGEIALLPVQRIDELGRDTRPLQPVHNLPDLAQILNHGPVGQMQFLNGRGVYLQRQLPRDGVPPRHGQDLDLVLLNGRQLGVRQLLAFGHHAQPVRARPGRGHPDVRVRRVLHFCGARKLLVGLGKEIVCTVRAHKGGAASGDRRLVVAPVVIAQTLGWALGHLDGHERRHARGV